MNNHIYYRQLNEAVELLTDSNDIIEARLLLASISKDPADFKKVLELCKTKNHVIGQIEIFYLQYGLSNMYVNSCRPVSILLNIMFCRRDVYCIFFTSLDIYYIIFISSPYFFFQAIQAIEHMLKLVMAIAKPQTLADHDMVRLCIKFYGLKVRFKLNVIGTDNIYS